MTSTSLSNRIAVVTGGSSGVGRGIAIELAREGAKVVVADVREVPKTGKYYDADLKTTTVEEVVSQGSEGLFESSIQDYLSPDDIEICKRKTALPRFGKPRDIGRACVFLASDDAEWITGTKLFVDGGWSASLR